MSVAETADRVHARAPGRISVFFEVGGRGRDGHRPIASVAQAVSVYSDVWAEPADRFTVTVDGPVDVSALPRDETNLAVRAARLLAAEIGWPGGVSLRVHRAVPVAGGMAGGAADAAAALVACDALWGAGLPHAELQELAARLGADVPFAIMGGTAVGTGRGDQLSPALAHGRFDWVLVAEEPGMTTADVYAELDEYRAHSAPHIPPVPERPVVFPPVLHALRQGDARMLAATSHNALDAAVLRLRPALDRLVDAGLQEGALTALVPGPGPTIAFLAEDEHAAIALQVALSAAGYQAMHAHGPVAGARVLTA